MHYTVRLGTFTVKFVSRWITDNIRYILSLACTRNVNQGLNSQFPGNSLPHPSLSPMSTHIRDQSHPLLTYYYQKGIVYLIK
jgi:hypothetical protein